MNRAMLLREKIGKLPLILAHTGVTITQEGTSAYVRCDATGKPTTVNLPYISDNAPEELMDAIEGFLDHEVAHLLFTDFSLTQKSKAQGFGALHGLLEDTCVEAQMAKKFPGTRANLSETGRFYLRQAVAPVLQDAMARHETVEAQGILMAPALRAWAGQQVYEDFMRDYWPVMQDIQAALGPLVNEIEQCRNTAETFALARKMAKALKAYDPSMMPSEAEAAQGADGASGQQAPGNQSPPEGGRQTESQSPGQRQPGQAEASGQQPESGAGQQAEGSKSEQPQGQGQQVEGGESGQPAGQGQQAEGREGGQPAGQGQQAESSKGEQPQGQGQQVEGSEGGQPQGLGQQAEGSKGGQPEGQGQQAEGSEGGQPGGQGQQAEGGTAGQAANGSQAESGAAGQAGGNGAEQGSEGGAAGQAAESARHGEGPAGAGAGKDASSSLDAAPKFDDIMAASGDCATQQAAAAQTAPGGADDTRMGEGVPGKGMVASGSSTFFRDIHKIMRNSFDEKLLQLIEKQAVAASSSSEYRVFSTEKDVVEILPVPSDADLDGNIRRLESDVAHLCGPMQKNLERIVTARSLAAWQPAQRSGRLHAASLARLACNDGRVFRKKIEGKSRDVAVELVIDCSGSMNGSRIILATQAAYALSTVLGRLNIANEVIGFTTCGNSVRDNPSYIKEMRSYDWRYSRVEALYMPIIKGYNERMTADIKRRFAWLPVSRILHNNVDGECVEIAARRLAKRPEKGKMMLVLSDGLPSAVGNHGQQFMYLKKTVREIEASGITVVGLGIQTDAVEKFYTKHMVVSELEDLPVTVLKQLKDLIVDD